ncbi:MAG: OmpH family outer membrane protein [Bacteroidales bacterium]|nr:OmpH family outer membrane protein [Bacteroidales bacterium]
MKKLNLMLPWIAIAGIIVTWIFFMGRTMKVVYVDNGVLMTKYEGMKDARKEYEKKAAVWQANADTLVSEWEKELKSYEKERIRMSAKERELKEQLLSNKQQQISQYREAVQMKAREEEQKMTQTVLNEVNDYLKEYGKKRGYTFILGATGVGNIVYANEARNITEEIIKGLNEQYNKAKK